MAGHGAGMAEHGAEHDRPLEFIPTWIIGGLLFVIVSVLLLVLLGIKRLGYWLRDSRKRVLFAAFVKTMEELALVGAFALVMEVGVSYTSYICVDSRIFKKGPAMCTPEDPDEKYAQNYCKNKNQEPLMSLEVLHKLHLFVFTLAAVHICYSCMVIIGAILKIRRCRVWEKNQAQLDGANLGTDPTNPVHRNGFLNYTIGFFRQFICPVTRNEYISLRRGLISKYNLPPTFNFYKHVYRSMEENFPSAASISTFFWCIAVFLIVANFEGSKLYLWVTLIPFVVTLLLGTKLQIVLRRMTNGYEGDAAELFWFNRPWIVLHLIYYINFQNGLVLASYFWFWWQFSFSSCLIQNHPLMYLSIALGAGTQCLTGWSLFPVYTLVTHGQIVDVIPDMEMGNMSPRDAGNQEEGEQLLPQGGTYSEITEIEEVAPLPTLGDLLGMSRIEEIEEEPLQTGVTPFVTLIDDDEPLLAEVAPVATLSDDDDEVQHSEEKSPSPSPSPSREKKSL